MFRLKAPDRLGLAADHFSRQSTPSDQHGPYLSALLGRLHLFLYVLDCEIFYLFLHLKFFQSGRRLSQWLLSCVHLEEDILLLIEKRLLP